MKIAFPTSGDKLGSPLNSSFGRSPKFLIYDLANDDISVIDNQQSLNASQGAGIQSAQTIARNGAQCLISGHCGPKAFRVLSAAGIKVYYTTASTIESALKAYRNGDLLEAVSADVDGHHA